MDADGNLYGTTEDGGASSYGTVFKVAPSGAETVLYSFDSSASGQYPFGGLVLDQDGVIYGTTQDGGDAQCWGGCGTVFKLDKSGSETVLLSFQPPAEYPTQSLTMDAAGRLYGITSGNGYCCLGTIFELSKSKARTLHTFKGGAGGEVPRGGLARDTRGNLYGTTFAGGDPNCTYGQGGGCGVVYRAAPGGKEAVLYMFTGADGAFPSASLLRDRHGSLYGTTSVGGAFGYGTVFKLDQHRKMTILHSFVNADGAYPFSNLVQDAAGNLYGTTYYGGDFACHPVWGCGVVFKITP